MLKLLSDLKLEGHNQPWGEKTAKIRKRTNPLCFWSWLYPCPLFVLVCLNRTVPLLLPLLIPFFCQVLACQTERISLYPELELGAGKSCRAGAVAARRPRARVPPLRDQPRLGWRGALPDGHER